MHSISLGRMTSANRKFMLVLRLKFKRAQRANTTRRHLQVNLAKHCLFTQVKR